MESTFEELQKKLFSDCIRPELEILIKSLKSLDDSNLTEEEKDYKNMCLRTLEAQLKVRYTKFDGN